MVLWGKTASRLPCRGRNFACDLPAPCQPKQQGSGSLARRYSRRLGGECGVGSTGIGHHDRRLRCDDDSIQRFRRRGRGAEIPRGRLSELRAATQSTSHRRGGSIAIGSAAGGFRKRRFRERPGESGAGPGWSDGNRRPPAPRFGTTSPRPASLGPGNGSDWNGPERRSSRRRPTRSACQQRLGSRSPKEPEDFGPSDGLSLDDAIGLLLRQNLNLHGPAARDPQGRCGHPDGRAPAAIPILLRRWPARPLRPSRPATGPEAATASRSTT